MAPTTRARTVRNGLPVNKLFDVAELLENVLYQLSPADIIVSKCVNRTFNNAIAGSQKLQRKMLQASQGEFAECFETFFLKLCLQCGASQEYTPPFNLDLFHISERTPVALIVRFEFSDEGQGESWSNKGLTVYRNGSWMKSVIGVSKTARKQFPEGELKVGQGALAVRFRIRWPRRAEEHSGRVLSYGTLADLNGIVDQLDLHIQRAGRDGGCKKRNGHPKSLDREYGPQPNREAVAMESWFKEPDITEDAEVEWHV